MLHTEVAIKEKCIQNLIKKPARYDSVFSYLVQFSNSCNSDFIEFLNWTDDEINLLCCSLHSNMIENNLFL